MTILEMSLGGGVLIAAILVLRRALLYRVPKWAFLLLWGVALCRLMLPFSVPSPVSVYTGAARISEALQEEAPAVEPAGVQAPVLLPPAAVPGTFRQDSPAAPIAPAVPEPDAPAGPEQKSVSPVSAVYLTGVCLCGLFFVASYLWSLRRFWDAVPAEGDFLRRWQEEHPTLLPVQIKVSRAVNAPLAYGLLRPVILLPKGTDWSDENQLTCMLTHEYVHVRRGDLLWKLLLAAALCIHWFNPLVWAMYFCANRDLELACDERVVRILGLDSRKGYARSLLAAAESRAFPLCTTYTTKNHMEERIRAIMKIRKQSLAAVLAALLLVTGVTAVFATSRAPAELDRLPQAAPGDPPPDAAHPSSPDLPADLDRPEDAAGALHGVSLPEEFETVPAPADEVSVTGAVTPTSEPARPVQSAYPVNSKGHTYGLWTEADGYEDVPDLIYVRWDSTTEGYLNRNEVYPYSWPIGPDSTQAELQRYVDWYHKQVQYDKPNESFVPYSGASFSLYDREETGIIGSCAGFEAETHPDSYKLSDEALLERVAQGNPVTWTLFLGTAPVENIPDASTQPFREVPKTEEEWALLEQWTENGDWRRNSKGQTYGPRDLGHYVGYFPELICRTASNGQSGYELLRDWLNSGYPGDIRNPDDALDYMDWLKTQPSVLLLPVYDLECTHIIGYTEVQNTKSEEYIWPEEEIEYRLNILENKFREWGLSEEEITRQLEEYKQSQGWS